MILVTKPPFKKPVFYFILVLSFSSFPAMSSCLSVGPVLGEAGILRPTFLRSGQKVQWATDNHSPLPETISLRFPAASATHRRFHPHPTTQGRRAVLSQPSPQYLQPEHLYVNLPKTPAS